MLSIAASIDLDSTIVVEKGGLGYLTKLSGY